jgi:phage gpG-like protein
MSASTCRAGGNADRAAQSEVGARARHDAAAGKPSCAPCSGCWCWPRWPSAWRWRRATTKATCCWCCRPGAPRFRSTCSCCWRSAAFSCIYLLARAVSHTLALPRAVAEFRRRRQQDKASQALRDAWRLLQEGRYGHALRCAEKARSTITPVRGMLALAGWRAAHACVTRRVRRNGRRACAATTARPAGRAG